MDKPNRSLICKHCLEESPKYFWTHPNYCPDPDPVEKEVFLAELNKPKFIEHRQNLQEMVNDSTVPVPLKQGAQEWIDRSMLLVP